MSLRHSGASGVRWTALSAVGTNVMGVTQLLVVARLLPPSEIGLMALVMVVTSFVSVISDFGVGSAVVQGGPVERAHLAALFWFNLLTGALLALAVAAGSSALAGAFGQPDLRRPLLLAASVFVVASIGHQSGYLLERDLRFDRIARVELAAALVGAVVTIGLAFELRNVFALVWGTVVTAAVKAAGFISSGVDTAAWSRPTVRGVGHYLRFGALHTGQRLVNFLGANADFVLIGRWVGSAALGQYSVAYNLANLPSSRLNPVLGRVFFPLLARIQDDQPRLKRAYLELQRSATTVTFPVLVLLACLAPSLPSLLGERWSESVVLLQALCVVGATRAVAGTVGPLILARGRVDLGFRWSLLVVALQVPAVAAGVALGEATGAVVAFAGVQVVLLVLNYLVLVRPLAEASAREYLATMTAPAQAAVLALGAGVLAGWALDSLVGAIAQVAVVSGTYILATLRLNRPAVEALRAVVRPDPDGVRDGA